VFRERARGSEFLDRPDADPRLVEQGYKFMKVVNRIGGGIRVVRKFLEQELSQSADADGATVLDIGAGDCDIALAITHWADRRGYKLRFTCLDHDPKAVELARSRIARCNCRTIEAVQADVFTYRPADKFDYALGSMTFHHFADNEIDALLAHLRGFVRKAVLINDLHRCLANYVACFLLALPLDREIRHDGLLSIRRGFKPHELARRLAPHNPGAVAQRMWFCRVAGVVRFDRGAHVG
jgi:2-polyprenyl-3-methyl-5-hydroxy-6-metoxy-1,4-benzoquinol methylase